MYSCFRCVYASSNWYQWFNPTCGSSVLTNNPYNNCIHACTLYCTCHSQDHSNLSIAVTLVQANNRCNKEVICYTGWSTCYRDYYRGLPDYRVTTIDRFHYAIVATINLYLIHTHTHTHTRTHTHTHSYPHSHTHRSLFPIVKDTDSGWSTTLDLKPVIRVRR